MFHRRIDAALRLWVTATALTVGSLVLFIVLFLLIDSIPAIRDIGITRFFTDDGWFPTHQEDKRYNLLPMIAGSLAVTTGAVVLAAPVGVACSLFIEFFAPTILASFYRRLIELLAGIPSVVFGFWGLVVLVPLLTHSLLAGILILALMILPTVTLITSISFASIPREYLRGAAALGMTRWGIVWNVAIPLARGGIFTATVLASARAVGETMAVMMVCGNVAQVPKSFFDPVLTLTANIAQEMSEATPSHRSVLFVCGVILMAMVGLLIVASELFGRRDADEQ